MKTRQLAGLLIILTMVATPLLAGETDAGPKRALTHADYDGWKTIRQPQVSDDGQWFLYRETPGEGDAELVVKNIDSGIEYRHAIGYAAPTRGRGRFGGAAPRPTDVVFSSDARFVVFLINPTFEETEKSRNQRSGSGRAGRAGGGSGSNRNQPVKSLGIMNLSDGTVEVIGRVKSFQLGDKSPDWLVYLNEEPKPEPSERGGRAGRAGGRGRPPESEDASDDESEKEKKYGTELTVRRIAGGDQRSIQSVLEYKLTKSADWLLYTVSDKEAAANDGVYAARPGSTDSQTVLSGEGNYTKWTLDEGEKRLAFLSDRDSYDQKQPIFKLYGWDLGGETADLWVAHDHTARFPKGMVVSDKENVRFSTDGDRVLFGIVQAPEPKSNEDDEDAPKKVQFDLWHWNDPYPTPQQKRLANRYKNETYDSIYHVDSGNFMKLADDWMPDVEFAKESSMLFASTDIPYRKLISWDSSYSDAYLIDPGTGERVKAAEKVSRPQLSPTGRYVFWFDGKDWLIFDGKARQQRNLTKGLSVSFAREDWDTPSTPRAYGVAGWTDGDEALLVYDHYDIWEMKADGTSKRTVTENQGRENGLSFRWVDLDTENNFVPASGELLLQATNVETMSTGFYRDHVSGTDHPSRVSWADAAWGRPTRARSADRLIVTKQSFSEYPDLWATTMDMSAPSRVTNLGSQMDAFLWGKAELRDFQSADGKPLKGILIKPENFDPSRKYPLMVYIYETLHNGVHRYRHPGPGTSINFSYYSSNDYVLWMPDIEYDTGYPGKDALKCVLPGVQMLVREGYVDEGAIGIQGHSWGGYQIAYMVTQTNIFKAAEAGAPVSNMTSAYGGIRWSSGMVRQFQYERTQSRLGDTLWNVPTRYINNSPVFFADRIQTPLLILHNDEDGAVPWYQGIELIMAMRRLGREGYMFNYNGEEHGLRKRDNQKHFTERMAEFFDHHLKGAPLPEWMAEGRMAWEKP